MTTEQILIGLAIAVPLLGLIFVEARLYRALEETTAAKVDAARYQGLYEGEKGRREAAERQAAHGVAIAPEARELKPAEPMSEEIARDLGKPFSEETLQRGIEDLRKQFAQAGVPVTDEQLRAEALLMLQSPEEPA